MLAAISHVFTLSSLSVIVLGVVWGLIFGIIPGLTATLAVVVLIPITYGLDPVSGIAMLVGVYIGGISGGLVSAILIGMPGTPSSITTAFDGYPMAKQGLAGKALGIGITSNLVGSLFGWIFLVTLAPQIARFALRFGSFEYVAVIVLGLTAVVSLSGDSLRKGMIMAVFGLMVSTIGMDPVYGMMRNTFGLDFLSSGISAIPAMIGLFVVSQVLKEMESISQKYLVPKGETGGVVMTMKEFKQSIGNFIRSGLIGVLIGILPGIGGALANFVAYDQAKKADPDPASFGKGNIQGIVASETSNNAVIGGALIPLLSLGIPGDAVTAVLLGGLQLHGLAPGPLLIVEHPELVYGVFVSFLIATAAMYVIMMLAGRRIFPLILRVQKSYLLPLVLVASLIGSYNLDYSLSDIWTALIFGVLGYLFQKKSYPLTPIVISLVLGKMLEKQLRLGLIQSNGSLLPFVTRPISLLFLVAAVVSIVISLKKLAKENGQADAA